MTKQAEHILSSVLELPMREQIVLIQRILDNISGIEKLVTSEQRAKGESSETS